MHFLIFARQKNQLNRSNLEFHDVSIVPSNSTHRDASNGGIDMSKRCYFDHFLTKHRFRFLDFSTKHYILMKNYLIYGIRNKWISDSNPSHRKDSDGQIISPYACYIAILHPKMCFHKAGQASPNQQSEFSAIPEQWISSLTLP